MATLPENVSQLSKMIPKPEKDLGCQDLILMLDVSKHGFIRKMPDSWSGRLFDTVLNRKWSSKFVVLRTGCVYIYSSETSLNYDRANSLFGFQDVLPCGNEVYKAGKWVFQVVDALRDQERDRSMFFSANSEADMKEWMESFQKEIIKGNMMMFNPAPSNPKLRQKHEPRAGAEALPQFSAEDREKMRKSITVATNVDIRIKNEDSSSDDDEDYTEIEEEDIQKTKEKKGSAKPLPAISPSSCPLPPIKVLPKPQPKPQPKPLPKPPVDGKPAKPIPGFGTAQQKPEVAEKKSSALDSNLTKPISAVKPMPSVPAQIEKTKIVKPSNLSTNSGPSLNERKVPPPPPAFPQMSVLAAGSSIGAYDPESLEMNTDYEQWDPRESYTLDPLIKASYWHEDSEKALQVMLSIEQDGIFLIRDASDGLDYKTLMVCTSEVESSVRKYKIIKEAGNLYSLHLGQSGFKSLNELIRYYQKNSLPNRRVKLTKPYTEVWKPN